eukprot:TRINITY_DN1208_c0_g1_i1.p2 TRINITY_DN1208_c0_g1~~TRINITY_DN1208_c0_g1_i1.p2  ORF type:complete len:120 (-),score=19.92 TRINITY_DN1208_c0_g1_i1:77-436(-)
MTAGSDHTCRIWSVDTGAELQRLEGHEDEIFSCAYNYEGDTIITGSKDNTCRIWKDTELIKSLEAKGIKADHQRVIHLLTHTPVSYTHLTLPTILLVQISVVAVSLKKKKKNTNTTEGR